MHAAEMIEKLEQLGIDFFAGVPDSLLQPFMYELARGKKEHPPYVVAVNEGAAAAMAAGYYVATKKIACVYLQNSGIGNIFNPVCSLTHDKVYGIPVLYLVGFRGEPGVKDEPQHAFQGEITLKTLELLEIDYHLLDKSTTSAELEDILKRFSVKWRDGISTALVLKKGMLESEEYRFSNNTYQMSRENAIRIIVENAAENALFVSSTGKISRELYEIRSKETPSKQADFLTVGSMGYASSIALSISVNKPERSIICLDGDGALLMHMGALATIGQENPSNLIHVVLDNEAHETVGGIPTASKFTDLCKIAESCGYQRVYEIDSENELADTIQMCKKKEMLTLVRVKVALGARKDLGRPKEGPKDNMKKFMESLKGDNI